jgi:hypothetical protein
VQVELLLQAEADSLEQVEAEKLPQFPEERDLVVWWQSFQSWECCHKICLVLVLSSVDLEGLKRRLISEVHVLPEDFSVVVEQLQSSHPFEELCRNAEECAVHSAVKMLEFPVDKLMQIS